MSVSLRACIGGAQGVIYLDNTGQPITGTGNLDSSPVYSVQFLTGTNSGGYAINGMQSLFADAVGSPDLRSYLRCDLCSSMYDLPYFVLDSFYLSDNPTNAGLHSFGHQQTSVAPVILDANTPYWLLFVPIGNSSVGEYRYSLTDSVNSIANDGWSITGKVWGGQIGLPMFTIDATALPEPSVLALSAVAGLLGLAGGCCRSFKK